MSDDKLNKIGPRVEHKCIGCSMRVAERFNVQGDVGTDTYCTHPEALTETTYKRRHMNSYSDDTPDWCPILQAGQASSTDKPDKLKVAVELLKVAKCPACDGSGGIPTKVLTAVYETDCGHEYESEVELEQCQWCDERQALTAIRSEL